MKFPARLLLLVGPFVMLMTYAPISFLVMGNTVGRYGKYAEAIMILALQKIRIIVKHRKNTPKK